MEKQEEAGEAAWKRFGRSPEIGATSSSHTAGRPAAHDCAAVRDEVPMRRQWTLDQDEQSKAAWKLGMFVL